MSKREADGSNAEPRLIDACRDRDVRDALETLAEKSGVAISSSRKPEPGINALPAQG